MNRQFSEVLKWALLSEGGNNTGPHMDAYGFSTWITMQQGEAGFGWLSLPSQEEENAWKGNTTGYKDGKWRFITLRQGETIILPAGTVHFVFRTNNSRTFAIGGHFIQWTGIHRWLEVMIAQKENTLITNEEICDIARLYVQIARALVRQHMKSAPAVPGIEKLACVSGSQYFLHES